MNAKTSKSGAVWLAAGIASLISMAMMPAARPVLRAQLGGIGAYRDFVYAALGSGDPSVVAQVQEKVKDAARGREDDAGAQIAVASFLPERKGDMSLPERERENKARRFAQLTALAETARRLNRPEADAALLVNACMGPFGVSRPEEERLFDDPKSHPYQPPPKFNPDRNAPEVLAMVKEATLRGEKLDPDNGFFPTMNAIGLLAENRDAGAWEAFHRAAQKPRFDDYAAVGAEGRLRLMNEVNGGPLIAPARMTVYAAVLLPHYARIRAMVRYAAVAATRRENSGDAKGGFVLRHDISRLGATMRTDSRLIIGSLVGCAITRNAEFRPDGTFPYRGLASDVKEATCLTDYLARLNALGEKSEAVWFAAELEKRAEVKNISKRGMERGVSNMIDMFADCWLWALGAGALAVAGFALCFAGVASLCARWVPMLSGRGRIGATVGFFAAAGIGVIALVSWLCGLLTGSFGFMTMLRGLWSEESTPNPSDIFRAVTLLLGALLLLTLPPLATMIRMIVRASRREGGGWEYARRGLPADTLRLTGILLLCFSASVAGAAVLETRIHGELNEMMRHEGRYYARLVGTQWPGKVGERQPNTNNGE